MLRLDPGDGRIRTTRAFFSVVLAAISVAWGPAASTLRLTVVDIHELAVPGARVEARPLVVAPPSRV
jgi:hypothetical protein